MKRANEIREHLNAAIASGEKKQMFDFAVKCKKSLSYCFREPRKNALKHAIDCVAELMAADWLVIEPQWCGSRKHMRLVSNMRINQRTKTIFFGVFSAKKFAKELNAKKREGSATHAYVINVADYLAYPVGRAKELAKYIYTGI